MNSPEAARKYLREVIPEGDLAAASRALRRNHAYLQQYIKQGKPLWLAEQHRAVLVALYPEIDPERLRPPVPDISDKTGLDRGNKRKVDVPHDGEVADDPRTIQLLNIWSRMPMDRRDMALRVMRGLAGDAEAIAI